MRGKGSGDNPNRAYKYAKAILDVTRRSHQFNLADNAATKLGLPSRADAKMFECLLLSQQRTTKEIQVSQR